MASSILIIATVTAACSDSSGASLGDSLADMEPVTLSYASYVPPESGIGKAEKAMVDYVNDESDGKITIELYASSSLLDTTAMLAGLRDGTADMGHLASTSSPAEFPIANWFATATSVHPDSFPAASLTGSLTNIDIYSDPELPFYQEFLDNGVVPLSMSIGLRYEMLCSKPMKTPEDLDGATVRSPGEPWTSEVKALGMTPVSMPNSEMYEALERGVIDCAVNPFTAAAGGGLLEVADTYLALPFSVSSGAGIAMNQASWESLPADAQQVIKDGLAVYASKGPEFMVEEYSALVQAIEEEGVELGDASLFADQLHAVQEERLSDMVSRAPDGIDDPEGLIQTYKDSVSESSAKLEEFGVPVTDDLSPEAQLQSFKTGYDQVDWDGYEKRLLESFAD